MARFTTGTTFTSTQQVTADSLNNAVINAAISTDSVDGTTIELNSNAVRVKDSGITTAKIADDAITFAKLADATILSIKQALYPVGSLLTTTVNYADSAAVVSAYGGTTWERFAEGKVLVGHSTTDSDFNAATPTTGGAKTHALTEAELAQHHHLAVVDGTVAETGDVTASNAISETATQSGSTFQSYSLRPATSGTFGTVGKTSQVGSGNAHQNLQPYITVYMWKRTA